MDSRWCERRGDVSVPKKVYRLYLPLWVFVSRREVIPAFFRM
ncbi:hypothetical protein LEP1GSC062_3107 [Leptospira alexanderi serovar Manhao 3 str. L 60]|uniref:Uncharacterized protein n=1 Tax=Leptospira alexanderi serovar Manhao 3 str. L 60 TaxID=1049759 RepID=V6I6N8_9LEPT|nr:hypothetical protein LEP1GSC062_3107 [Leptospira alexanderi serovar Manhao 3 str. L 60]